MIIITLLQEEIYRLVNKRMVLMHSSESVFIIKTRYSLLNSKNPF